MQDQSFWPPWPNKVVSRASLSNTHLSEDQGCSYTTGISYRSQHSPLSSVVLPAQNRPERRSIRRTISSTNQCSTPPYPSRVSSDRQEQHSHYRHNRSIRRAFLDGDSDPKTNNMSDFSSYLSLSEHYLLSDTILNETKYVTRRIPSDFRRPQMDLLTTYDDTSKPLAASDQGTRPSSQKRSERDCAARDRVSSCFRFKV